MPHFQGFITHLLRFHPHLSIPDNAEALLGSLLTTNGLFWEISKQEARCVGLTALSPCSLIGFLKIKDEFKVPRTARCAALPGTTLYIPSPHCQAVIYAPCHALPMSSPSDMVDPQVPACSAPRLMLHSQGEHCLSFPQWSPSPKP